MPKLPGQENNVKVDLVYGREEARIYPESLLNLGLMQKQNAKYNIALETFKRVKKKSYKNKKSYNYQKAKKEIVLKFGLNLQFLILQKVD